jgi:hypothetical protein
MSEPPREVRETRREPRDLEETRRELVRLGYLSHRVERFLLQDALVPRGLWRDVARLSGKVGLLGGSLIAAVAALGLAAANGALASTPADVLPLFLHLALPSFLVTAVGFALVVALYVGALSAFPRRSRERIRLATAIGATAALVAGGVLLGLDYLVALPRLERAAVAAAVPLVAAGFAKLFADGLLAFGIRLTRQAPHQRFPSRRAVAGTVAGSIALLAAVATFLPAAAEPPAPAALPTAPGERVALVGVDGVLPDELEFLLARGELPSIARLAAAGAGLAAYRRDPGTAPAEHWTTVATGQPPARHGVVALDSFRPAGVATPIARSGPWRRWFDRVERPLGLAEYRPLLAGRRRAPFVWELVSRGGAPVAALGWWATFPAEELPGLVLAHGGHGLLAAGTPGAAAPASRAAELARRAAETEPGSFAAPLEAALDRPRAAAALERAVLPDRFASALAVEESAAGARAVAVYLPGLDLLADGWTGGPRVFAELVRLSLIEADALIGELAKSAGTVVVLFDPGRRGGGEGRALVARDGCAAEARPRLEPAQAAAALARAAGLPQSRELPEPPAFCPWPAPPATVDGYGERRAPATPDGDPDAYLESLRSLGYL